MSKKLTRRQFLATSGVIAAAALAGCVPIQVQQAAPAEGEKSEAAPAAATKSLTLSVWGAVQEDVLYTDVYIPEYQKQNPDVKVDFLSIPDFDDYYDKLIQLHAAGTPVEVQRHNVQRLGQVVGKDMLLEMSALYERDKVDTEDFLRGIMPAISRDGGSKIYAIPQDENLYGLLYNPDAFDEAGLSYPDDEYTFDKMVEDAQALTKRDASGNVTQFGFISWWNFWNLTGFILGYGGQMWENLRTPEEKVVVNEAWYQALELWKKLMLDFQLAPAQEQVGNLGPNVFFEQRRAAMFVDGTWREPFVKKAAPDLNFACTTFPKGTVKKSRGSTVCWGVSTGAKDVELAWDLAKYLYTPEALLAYWQILWVAPPARLSVVQSEGFKTITGLSSGGIDYPGLADANEWEQKSRWIVTTLENGWDTQEFTGDNYSILAREMDAAIEAVLVPNSTVTVEEAIDQAIANTNREIELNR